MKYMYFNHYILSTVPSKMNDALFLFKLEHFHYIKFNLNILAQRISAAIIISIT